MQLFRRSGRDVAINKCDMTNSIDVCARVAQFGCDADAGAASNRDASDACCERESAQSPTLRDADASFHSGHERVDDQLTVNKRQRLCHFDVLGRSEEK